jgi:hypothetical protein
MGFLGCLALLVAAEPAATPLPPETERAICLVLVKTEEGLTPQSGFFISSEGWVLTAAHAWPDDAYAFDSFPWVWTADGGKYRAEVETVDWSRDLALLYVVEELAALDLEEETPEEEELPLPWAPVADRHFPFLRLAYADQSRAGDAVTVAGYAGIGQLELMGWPGPALTLRRGSLLGRRRDPTTDHFQIFDLGLKLSHGLSGAPVLDAQGRVLGMACQWTQVTAEESGEELGFSSQAISSKTLAWWLREELGAGWRKP